MDTDSTPCPILDGYILPAKLADELGVHPQTLKRWKARRYGPKPVRVGRRVYYRRDDVRTWLSELGQQPEPKRGSRGRV